MGKISNNSMLVCALMIAISGCSVPSTTKTAGIYHQPVLHLHKPVQRITGKAAYQLSGARTFSVIPSSELSMAQPPYQSGLGELKLLYVLRNLLENRRGVADQAWGELSPLNTHYAMPVWGNYPASDTDSKPTTTNNKHRYRLTLLIKINIPGSRPELILIYE